MQSAYRVKSNKNRSSEQRKETRKCFSCGLAENIKANCRKRQENNRAEAKHAETKEHELCLTAMDSKQKSSMWFVDSGATNHLSSNRKWFNNLEKINKNVCLTDKRSVLAVGIGDVSLIYENGMKVTLQNV